MKNLLAFAVLAFGLLSSPVAAQNECQQSCGTQYDVCSASCGGMYGCEESCQNQLDSCWAACPPCPTTRDYSTITVLSRTYTNRNGCYQDHLYLTGGRRYYEYYTKERKNTYRETTQCDGSKSTQLLSSSTYNYYCWVRGNTGSDSCSYPSPNYLFICH